MFTRFVQTFALLFIALSTATAGAAGLSGAAGVTGDGDAVLRLGVTSDWEVRWFETEVGSLTGYWDTAYTYWDSGDRYSAAHSLSWAPVLMYEFTTDGSLTPFVEAGVGLVLFSKTRVGEHELGSAFSFENRIGMGVEFANEHRLGLRAMHYSNAGIKQPNDGIESYSLFYSWMF